MTHFQSSTAQYYDILYKDWISEERTDEELSMFQDYIDTESKILDIGCGTGRHLVPLSLSGFEVVGIENSELMKEALLRKIPESDVVAGDFYKATKQLKDNSFDLAICMWNAIFEIAGDFNGLEQFFKQVYGLLRKDGVLILSASDSDNFEVQDYDFVHKVKENRYLYKLSWKVLTFDRENLITTSQEIVEVFDKDTNLVDIQSAEITQKHWRMSELIEYGRKAGFDVETKLLAGSDDSYFIFSKN